MKVKLDPDWSVNFRTISEFKERLELRYRPHIPCIIDFKGERWYDISMGALLILELIDSYQFHLWFNDPRPQYRKLLGVEDVR